MKKAPVVYSHLSPQETENPILAFDELFDLIDLPSLKVALWEGLKATVTDTYKSLPKHEKALQLEIYEKLQKVIEAAHVIHISKRIKNSPTNDH